MAFRLPFWPIIVIAYANSTTTRVIIIILLQHFTIQGRLLFIMAAQLSEENAASLRKALESFDHMGLHGMKVSC